MYCAAAPDYPNFEAARILQGFFSTVTQSGGLVFIQDMFFFHEQVRTFALDSGILAQFIIYKLPLGSNDQSLGGVFRFEPLPRT